MVKGKSGENAKLLKERLIGSFEAAQVDSNLAKVRVKQIRESGDKLYVETMSAEDRSTIISSQALESTGLKVSLPTTRKPRLMIRRVPKSIPMDMLVTEVHRKNLEDIIGADEIAEEMKVITRDPERETANVVLETSERVHKALMAQKRVFVGFEALVITNLEGVQACFNCRSTLHSARNCDVKGVCCYKCGTVGHAVKECKSAIACKQCRESNRPYTHFAASPACPIWARAQMRLTSRRYVEE